MQIQSGCDLTGDGFNDLKVCAELEDSSISTSKSEDLVGVAFDMFKGCCTDAAPWESMTIGDITVFDHSLTEVVATNQGSFIDQDEVCSIPGACATDPSFIVRGANVPTPYVVAVKCDSGISGNTDIKKCCFTISAPGFHMPVEALGPDMYARIFSTNDNTSTSKMTGTLHCPAAAVG